MAAEIVQMTMLVLFDAPSPNECYEDLLWALINSTEFLYRR